MKASATIALSQGRVALVDDDDFERVAQFKWCTVINNQPPHIAYAMSALAPVKYLHRFILRAKRGQSVDHINGDGLDNRRANLRIASSAENSRNRRRQLSKKSKYKGAFHRPGFNKPWMMRLQYARTPVRKVLTQSFYTEEEAARAYDNAAKQLFGPFARLNFPNDQSTVPPDGFFKPQESSECETTGSDPEILRSVA